LEVITKEVKPRRAQQTREEIEAEDEELLGGLLYAKQ